MSAASSSVAKMERIRIPYSPNYATQPFHQSKARDRLLNGGLGSGKTTAGAAEHIKMVARCGPDMLHLVGAPSNKVMRYNTFPAVIALLNAIRRSTGGWSPAKKVWDTDANRQILWKNGARTLFLTVRDPNEIMGYSTCGHWFDELALIRDSQAALQAGMNRRRQPGARCYYGIYTTSPRGPVGAVDTIDREVTDGNPEYSMTTISSYANQRNLPPSYIPDMMKGMSRRQVEQDIYGQIVRVAGSVYSGEYSPKYYPAGSVLKDWSFRKARRPEFYVYLDWGPSNPHALFVEYDAETDRDVVFDEVCEDGMDHRTFLGRVASRLADPWKLKIGDLKQVWCDPNPIEAVNIAQQVFRGTSLQFLWGQDINPGVDVVRRRLCEYDGTRRLLFAARLLSHTRAERRISQCMLLYKYTQRHTDEGLIQLDVAQKGKFDHGCDALRYGTSGRYQGKLAADLRGPLA